MGLLLLLSSSSSSSSSSLFIIFFFFSLYFLFFFFLFFFFFFFLVCFSVYPNITFLSSIHQVFIRFMSTLCLSPHCFLFSVIPLYPVQFLSTHLPFLRLPGSAGFGCFAAFTLFPRSSFGI